MKGDMLVPRDPDRRAANNFDALRLFFAILVVWSHSFALWYGSEEGEPLSRLMNGAYNAGNIGVLGFFSISGFLIALSYERSSSLWIYLRRRIARIHPGYLVAVTLCSLVVVPLYSSRAFLDLRAREIAGLFSNLLLRNFIIQSDAFNGGAVNGSLWSIPYEFWCYLGVMALGLSGLLRRRWVAPTLAIIVQAVRVWLDATGRHPGGGIVGQIVGYPYFWFMVLPSFLWGTAIWQHRDVLPRNGPALCIAILALIAAARLSTPVAVLLMPPVLAWGIFHIAFTDRLHLHGAARFGDFSYGTYLYAFPIQQMLRASIGGAVGFGTYVALSIALSLIGGVLSWHLVERWFVGIRRRSRPLDREAAIAVP